MWTLLVYDLVKTLHLFVLQSKDNDSSINLDEPRPTPEEKCYVIVNQVEGHYEITISNTKDTAAVRCEECNNRKQAECLADLARIMYKSN